LTLLEVDVHPPVITTSSGVELGCKLFSITITMEFVGYDVIMKLF
jgi:hypothetical protein